MKYHSDLKFTQRLLKQMLLPSHVISLSQISHSKEIDLRLRYLLCEDKRSYIGLRIDPESLKEKTIYRMTDEYHCSYIFFRIPDSEEDKCFFIGPYIKNEISENELLELEKKHMLFPHQISQLKDYYLNLSLFPDEGIIYSIVNTLSESIWDNLKDFSLEYINYKIPQEDITDINLSNASITEEPLLAIEALEKRYAEENDFIQSISQGNMYKISYLFSNSFQKGMEQRVTDPIRNIKNYMIILNTILRKAVEQGAVHPFYIDRLSSSYARKIETIRSIADGASMQKEMIHKYCLLVKNYSLKEYSPVIQRIITYIGFDISSNLSLKEISKKFNMNASYLSNLFKKETGQTLTDYVSQKRIQHAVHLLNHTDMQIQMIAHSCGIQDVNYFVKVFKKYIKMTPSEYRKYIS